MMDDDGIGGAEPGLGSDLIGIAHRVDALCGRLDLHRPPGGGTTISIEVPIRAPASA
jgi:signal transduction histidine kinase